MAVPHFTAVMCSIDNGLDHVLLPLCLILRKTNRSKHWFPKPDMISKFLSESNPKLYVPKIQFSLGIHPLVQGKTGPYVYVVSRYKDSSSAYVMCDMT